MSYKWEKKRCNLKYIFGWFHEWYSYMFKSLISFYRLPSGINIHRFEPLRQTDKLHVLYFFGRNLAHSALDKRSTLWGKQAKLYVLFPQFSSLCTLDKRREPTLESFCTYCFVLSYIPRDYSLRRVSVVDYYFFGNTQRKIEIYQQSSSILNYLPSERPRLS